MKSKKGLALIACVAVLAVVLVSVAAAADWIGSPSSASSNQTTAGISSAAVSSEKAETSPTMSSHTSSQIESSKPESSAIVNEPTITFSVGTTDRVGYLEGAQSSVSVIKSYANFQETFASYSTILNKYNGVYFNENALVVVSLVETSGSIRDEIKQLTKDDGKLCVGVKSYVPGYSDGENVAMTTDMAAWRIILEVKKI